MNKAIVLPSARAIRHRQLSTQEDALFLPDYITMSDFITKLCIVEDFSLLDEDTRILLLLEASQFENFSKLKIERNFFTFTKNSSYIFKFFEEISAEMYDINRLDTADIYAEYEEHITILQELYKRYEKILYEKKLLDKIFLPKLYKLNTSYIQKYQEITIYVDGYLTNFELELLKQCSTYTHIILIFTTSFYNKKMQEKFSKIIDENFEIDYRYEIDFNTRKIQNKTKLKKNKQVTAQPLSESLLQIAFIKEKVYHFIQKGYQPQNIAVILPNENMAKLLRSFDEEHNFNFAMGMSYTSTFLYQKLYATKEFLDQETQENIARLKRYGDEIYTVLFPIYHQEVESVDILALLESFTVGIEDKTHLQIYQEELYRFGHIVHLMQKMKVKSLFALFLQRLSKRTLDDVYGGKITVMGVLETRGMNFDGVVLIDFNDNYVPKKSDKDMFLNTKIRQRASLPTMSDRENLQKHYYYRLINGSKEVAIAYVHSHEMAPSRFLKQLHIKQANSYNELDYAKLLLTHQTKEPFYEEPIILKYSFRGVTLSNTKLKTYLTCKRKYYYQYIKQLKSHEIPKDISQEHKIGTIIHLALKNLYQKKNRYDDVEMLQNDLYKELDALKGKNEFDKYLINIQKKQLQNFCVNEVKRFALGWSVFACEKVLTTTYAGIEISGQIDRIDIHQDGSFALLDYKTGSYNIYSEKNYKEATDFQLEFYYLLASTLGNVVECGFYDLKENMIVYEKLLHEKLEVLKEHISHLLLLNTIEFTKCEDTANCRFCEYKKICHRE
ncbi:FIG00388203: hypothetical protein [hydrothermal vent metagenome]|uniref:PD-(D/E)XK endonuclease-like domain-containing protein n=1 Tax=hydrothermal vent metagenome TaxID=652676 RepID=A0A1W1D5S2_9ZZZZ